MTRIGINPSRGRTSDYKPARLTAVVITHIPHLEGYFHDRLSVLRLSLSSLIAHTRLPYDLMVFDNGSCATVVEYLRSLNEQGVIQYLFLARQNIGKIGAFQIVFRAAPGELIAYSDDDILFYPDWLEATLRIIDTYPRAGMVSCFPVRNGSRYAIRAIERLADQKPPGIIITRERRIPDEWETDWALSTGREPQEHLNAQRHYAEYVLCKEGVETIATANHFQFVSPRSILIEALPGQWSGKLMGEMIEVDEAIDNAGYLRLSTTGRYTRHIGNVVNPELLAEAQSMHLDVQFKRVVHYSKHRHWLARFPGVRRMMVGLYNRMFNLLNDIETHG